MQCPKCKAVIGVMRHAITMDMGVVAGYRCVMCGYWKFEHPIKQKKISSPIAADR